MTFNSYLNLNLSKFEEIIEYYLDFLDDFSSNNFPYEKNLKFKGIATKFINCLYENTYLDKNKQEEYFDSIDIFNDSLSTYWRRIENRTMLERFLIGTPNYQRVKNEFETIYSKTLDLINVANKTLEHRRKRLDINDFYNPENSNKSKIKKLILEAIDLISTDISLTEKSRKRLIEYLNNVLSNLDSEHTDWTKIIGKIKETIIVLGALGSFIGVASPLFMAKEKLEETTVVIEKTSINLNYKVINETFNLNEIKNLNSTNSFVLQLEENIDTKEKN